MDTLIQDPSQQADTLSLAITLFGPPQLVLGGTPVPLARRQLRALLYRLAVTLQPVSRDQLCFLIWPNTTDTVARRNLTVLLNQLRQALPHPEAIQTQGDQIWLDRAYIHVDTVAFVEAISQAAQQGKIEYLASAVELYTGSFLDRFSLPTSAEFETWVMQERQSLERRYLDALATLTDEYAARGAYLQAIAMAQRALAIDNLAEEMHRQLIALYAAVGDRTAALRQFESCVVALERELGVSPLPETRAVYEAVRSGQMPLRGHSSGDIERVEPLLRYVEPHTDRPPESAPIRSHASPPTPSAPLLGRQNELAAIYAMLTGSTVRLLTLTGTGGSGKTRLAIQAAWNLAANFADDVVFVTLSPLYDAELVLVTIGQACGLQQATPNLLAEYLHNKQLLLVLDNCEHLLAAAPEIAELLAVAPGLRVLATSRAPLNLQGERIFPVPPLPLPDLDYLFPLAELAEVPSMALLLARTQALNPTFQLTRENAAHLAAICVRLDGLPLAIELAAARLKVLDPRDLLRRLDKRLTLLTHAARDLPERHQTLRATIDWSYRLLDVNEQIWFERCSVFAGSWTLAAVEALDEQLRWRSTEQGVAHDAANKVSNGNQNDSPAHLLDVLTALVDKSLVQVNSDEDGTTRFSMLETLREFAAEQLHARATASAVAQAHADYYRELVEPWDANAPMWLTNMARELDNLRAALRWYLGRATVHVSAIELMLQLGALLNRFWYWRDWITEARWWLEQMITASAGVRSEARAIILNGAALAATVQGDKERAIELHEINLRLSEELQLGRQRANSLNALGAMACQHGDFPRAITYGEEALAVAQQIGSPDVLTSVYYTLATILVDEGRDTARAVDLFETCLALARQHQLAVIESMALGALGMTYTFTGEAARAAELLPVALRKQREMNATRAIGLTLQSLGFLAYRQADYGRAAQYFMESLDGASQGGARFVIPTSLEGIAGIVAARQLPQQAARLLGAAEALRETIQLHRSPIEHVFYDKILDKVYGQLSAEALRAAWQAGRQLTQMQAIAEAEASVRGKAQHDEM